MFTPTLCVHTRPYLSGLLTPTPHMMPVCSQSDRLCLGTLTKLVLDLARVARRKFERTAASEPFTLSGGVERHRVLRYKRPACLSGDPAPSRLNALRLKPATPSALWGRGSGTLPGGAQPFQVEPGSRPAAPGVSGGARSDDPNRLSRPTPERALPSRVGGAAEAASAPPRLRGGRRYR